MSDKAKTHYVKGDVFYTQKKCFVVLDVEGEREETEDIINMQVLILNDLFHPGSTHPAYLYNDNQIEIFSKETGDGVLLDQHLSPIGHVDIDKVLSTWRASFNEIEMKVKLLKI